MERVECPLCKAEEKTRWYHTDDVCWVADCDTCAHIPMVVLHEHREPTKEEKAHMIKELKKVADGLLGEEHYYIDDTRKTILNHPHIHVRIKNASNN